jgi:hypothetical protein
VASPFDTQKLHDCLAVAAGLNGSSSRCSIVNLVRKQISFGRYRAVKSLHPTGGAFRGPNFDTTAVIQAGVGLCLIRPTRILGSVDLHHSDG